MSKNLAVGSWHKYEGQWYFTKAISEKNVMSKAFKFPAVAITESFVDDGVDPEADIITEKDIILFRIQWLEEGYKAYRISGKKFKDVAWKNHFKGVEPQYFVYLFDFEDFPVKLFNEIRKKK